MTKDNESLRASKSPASSDAPPSTPSVCNCNERESDANEPMGGWQGATLPPCPVHDRDEGDDEA
jgi:hypothetical protein